MTDINTIEHIWISKCLQPQDIRAAEYTKMASASAHNTHHYCIYSQFLITLYNHHASLLYVLISYHPDPHTPHHYWLHPSAITITCIHKMSLLYVINWYHSYLHSPSLVTICTHHFSLLSTLAYYHHYLHSQYIITIFHYQRFSGQGHHRKFPENLLMSSRFQPEPMWVILFRSDTWPGSDWYSFLWEN